VPQKLITPRLIGIVQHPFPNARIEQRDYDGAAGSASADLENLCSLQPAALARA
jgi:hypothetical protein